MSEDLTYRVEISIIVPEREKPVQITAVLHPDDPVSGQGKRLRDCTLADLRQFAADLNDEFWQTWASVRVEEALAHPETAAKIQIQPLETADIPPDNRAWLDFVLYPPENTPQPLNEPATTDAPDTPEPLPPHPEVTVLATEPVYPEREVVGTGTSVTPTIAPSMARVRVAGRRLPTGMETWAAADVLIDEPALRAAQAHAFSSMDREVAGVLVGPPPEKQPDGRYVVHIIDTIAARYTVMQGASVTYTPESWRYMHDRLLEKYPDETAVIVGWYHTHPGFGIFLSGMDQFIHRHFFTQIWHVALVIDPRARTAGFFCWDRQKTAVRPYDFPWPPWTWQ